MHIFKKCYLPRVQHHLIYECRQTHFFEGFGCRNNAHNDEQRIVNSENLPDRYPISYPDVQEMIDFALDCTGLILGILTDVNRAKQYSNIDDWEGTLMLTRLGLKYREYDFQQSEKAFEEEMRRQLGGNDNGKLQ